MTGVEPFSLVPNDDANSLLGFAAATDMNQLVSVQGIAVEHRVTQRFADLRQLQRLRFYRLLRAFSFAIVAQSSVLSSQFSVSKLYL